MRVACDMLNRDRIHEAVDSCFDAVLTPEMWPDALGQLAASVDAVCCGFYPRDSTGARLSLPVSPHYRSFLEEFLRDGWWRSDHRAKRGWPLAEAGRQVLIEHDIASDHDRRTLAQYHELYPRYDVPWWGAVFFRDQSRLWGVPFLRSTSQGPFDRADAESLTELIPHLRRVVRYSSHLSEGAAKTALDLLEATGSAAMFVDWAGSVVLMNRAAEELLGKEVRVARGCLAVINDEVNRRARGLITAAAEGRRPSALPKDPVVVPREGRRPLLLDALPVSEAVAGSFSRIRAVIFIRDLEHVRRPPEERVMVALGLTRSEARTAMAVGAGRSPRAAAAELRITEETARTNLKRAFAKVGISRQSELSALLANIALD